MLVLLLLLLMFLLFLLLLLLFGLLVALRSVGKRSDPKGPACPSGSSKHSSPSLPPHPSVAKEKPPKKAICGGFPPKGWSPSSPFLLHLLLLLLLLLGTRRLGAAGDLLVLGFEEQGGDTEQVSELLASNYKKNGLSPFKTSLEKN